jgi:hypothetical protein
MEVLGRGRNREFHRPLDRSAYISSPVRNCGLISRSQFFIITNCLVYCAASSGDVLRCPAGNELVRKPFCE